MRRLVHACLPWLNQPLEENGVATLLAGLSALMYGAGDFCGGLASRRMPLFTVLVFSQLVGLLVAVAAALAFGQRLPAAADVLWGAAAGVFGAAGLAALYRALATTLVAVASPVAAVTGAAIPVLMGLALGERPGVLAWAGIGVAVSAIVLLAAGPAEHARKVIAGRAALLGAAAGVGFGMFFFSISRTSSSSGLWPLAAARCATITLVVLAAVLTRRSLRPGRTGFSIALLSGALDMGANIAFLLASRIGLLSVTAVVTSLYPGPTVLLAMLVFRERLTAPRVLGLALALAGVALISA
jgi:drug/metabolite transporter (DMT)-like permease